MRLERLHTLDLSANRLAAIEASLREASTARPTPTLACRVVARALPCSRHRTLSPPRQVTASPSRPSCLTTLLLPAPSPVRLARLARGAVAQHKPDRHAVRRGAAVDPPRPQDHLPRGLPGQQARRLQAGASAAGAAATAAGRRHDPAELTAVSTPHRGPSISPTVEPSQVHGAAADQRARAPQQVSMPSPKPCAREKLWVLPPRERIPVCGGGGGGASSHRGGVTLTPGDVKCSLEFSVRLVFCMSCVMMYFLLNNSGDWPQASAMLRG